MGKRFYPLFLLLWVAGCRTIEEKKPPADSVVAVAIPGGTEKMARRLKQIADSPTLEASDFRNAAAAEEFRLRMVSARSPQERFQLQYMYCIELLNAGKGREAVAEIENLISQAGETAVSERSKPVFDLLAVAYLRLGEQENCIHNHNGQSCILPLGKDGLHKLPMGSRKAAEIYGNILEKFPEDLNSVWLMNLAYMTLGEFPGKVPAKFRLPASAFRATGGFPRFANIAGEVGADADGLAGGTVVEDFNNDGLLDILNSAWLRDSMHFYVNDGRGGFADKASAAGLDGLMGGLNMASADYDNDGDVDVLVLRGGWLRKGGNIPNSLLRNNGDGTFTDVTEAAGVYSEHPTQTAAWADFNLDGHLDLFIGNESGPGFRNPCEFYWNNGDGSFTAAAGKLGLDVVDFVKAAAPGDADGDGRTDLYLSVYGGENRLFLNRGGSSPADWKFEEGAAKAGVQEPIWSFPAWFWDFDNDGDDDLFVSGYQFSRFEYVAEEEVRALKGMPPGAELPRLYRNNGDGTFTDVARQAGIQRVFFAMGSNYDDIDNDGFLDFYLGTGVPDLRAVVPNRMFRNLGGKAFEDVTNAGGFGHIQKGHGVGFGDMDNDGDQDIYLDVGGVYEADTFRNALFENPGNRNLWIVLKLQGVTANRGAVGARVRLVVTEKGKRRLIYRTVGTGGSFGCSSLQLETGIGSATLVDTIEVVWPNAGHTRQTFATVAPGKKYLLKEGVDSLAVLPHPTFAWKKSAPGEHVHHGHHHSSP